MTIYEVAIRNEDGELIKIADFTNKTYIENYVNNLKNLNLEKSEIIILEKTYECINTTPHLVNK